MRNMKASTLWILALLSALASVGLIFACVYTSDWVNKMVIVLMAISFLAFTFLVQAATTKSIKLKPKKEKHTIKLFKNTNNLHKVLRDNKFEKRTRGYGESYLLIDGKRAFKVVLVSDPEGYFHNNDVNETTKENKELDKCDVFIGTEIFLNKNDELISKITDFSLVGGRVYYTALTKETDSIYKCHNFIEPLENQKEAFEDLYRMLGFEEFVIQTDSEESKEA